MLLPFFAAFALSAPAPSVALASQENDAAWLVPADATVLVRLESAQAWNELVRAFAPLAGEGAATHDLQAVLDSMGTAPVPGSQAALPRIDPARPVYVAVSLDPSSGQTFTLVAPVTNGQPFRFSPAFGPTTNVVRGSYTGASNRAGYAASASPNPRLAALRPGLVSVHLDLATLIATYRPMIDMGLAQFEMMLDQTPSDDEMPFDVQPLMEVYLGAARALVDGADALDLQLEKRGDELALRLDYLEREEREPAGMVADVVPFLGTIDPSSSAQVVLTGKWTEVLALFDSVTEAMVDVYPEPLRSDVQRLLRFPSEMDALLLPGLVVGFDFGAEGVHGSYVMRSSQPAELQAKLEALVRELDHEGGLLSVGTAERLVIEGLEARVLPLEIQHEAMLHALAEMSAASGGLPPEAENQFRATMETIYGRDLRLAMVPRGELLAVCVAGDDSGLRAHVARLKTPAAPSPKLVRLVQHIPRGALGFAYQLDFGRSMGQVFQALQGVLPGAVAFPDQEASFGFWGATGGRTWSGGMVMRLDELIAFGQALEAAGN